MFTGLCGCASVLTRDVNIFYEVVLYNKCFCDLSEHMTKEQTCVIVEFHVLSVL